jgi:2-methylisocitrate lyase-like PEP mutase family enzyme
MPVNIMLNNNSLTRKQLGELGVARISHGPGPYRMAMKYLQDAASLALQ